MRESFARWRARAAWAFAVLVVAAVVGPAGPARVRGVQSPNLFVYDWPSGVVPLAPDGSGLPTGVQRTQDDQLRVVGLAFAVSCSPVSGPNATDCAYGAGTLTDGTCALTLAASSPPSSYSLIKTSGSASIEWFLDLSSVGTTLLNASLVRCESGSLAAASSTDDPSYAVVDTIAVNPRPFGSVAVGPSQVTVGGALILSASGLVGGSPPYALRWTLLDSGRTLAVLAGVTGPSAATIGLAVAEDLTADAGPRAHSVALTIVNAEGGISSANISPSQTTLVPPPNATLLLASPALTAGADIDLVMVKSSGGGTGPAYTVLLELIDVTAPATPAATAHGTLTTLDATYAGSGSTVVSLHVPYAGSFQIQGYLRDASNVTVGPLLPRDNTTTLTAPPGPVLQASAAALAPTTVTGNLSAVSVSLSPGTGSAPALLSYTLVRDSDAAVLASGSGSGSSLTFGPIVSVPSAWALDPDTALSLIFTATDAAGVSAAPLTLPGTAAQTPSVSVVQLEPSTASVGGVVRSVLAVAGGTAPFTLSITAGAPGPPLAPSLSVPARGSSLALEHTLTSALLPSASLPVNVSFCVTVVDAAGVTSTPACSADGLTLNPRPTAVLTAAPAAFTATATVSFTLANVTGGTVPMTAVVLASQSVSMWSSSHRPADAFDLGTLDSVVPGPLSLPQLDAVWPALATGVWYVFVDVVDATGSSSLVDGAAGVAVNVAARPALDQASLVVDPLFLSPNASLTVTVDPHTGGSGSCGSIAFWLVAEDAVDPSVSLGPLGSAASCLGSGPVSLSGLRIDTALHPGLVRVAALATDATGVSAAAPVVSSAIVSLVPGSGAAQQAGSPDKVLGFPLAMFLLAVVLPLALCCLLLLLVGLWAFRRRRRQRREQLRPPKAAVEADVGNELAKAPAPRTPPLSSSSAESQLTETVGFESSRLSSSTETVGLDELFNRADGAINATRERMRYDGIEALSDSDTESQLAGRV